jgi:hypothetical protein
VRYVLDERWLVTISRRLSDISAGPEFLNIEPYITHGDAPPLKVGDYVEARSIGSIQAAHLRAIPLKEASQALENSGWISTSPARSINCPAEPPNQ